MQLSLTIILLIKKTILLKFLCFILKVYNWNNQKKNCLVLNLVIF